MTRSRFLFFLLSAAVVLPVLCGALWVRAARGQQEEEDSFYKFLSVFTEVLTLVRQAYVEEPPVRSLMGGALDGVTDALDVFSTFIPAPEVPGYLAPREVGTARSGLVVGKERGIVFAAGVVAGSPAEKAGMQAGDVLAGLAGRSTREMALWEIHEILAQPAGTQVDLELLREWNPLSLTLTLAEFTPPVPRVEERDGVPVLRVAALERGTAVAVRPLLEDLTHRGAPRLLLDLRGVAGGEGEAAYAVAALFVRGPLGELHGRSGVVRRFDGPEPPLWTGRLVVLTDHATLGPAEVLAAALRQGAGAELVGERTFGFAGRQTLVEISGGDRLLLADAYYGGPDGAPIREPLAPDLLVDETSRRFGDQDVPLSDLILQRGLERALAPEPLKQVA